MHRHHFHAQILGDPRQFGSVQTAMVPAHPHFERDGDIDRLNRGGNDRGRIGDITHQCGSRIAIDDLLDRAAHVDVDDRRTPVGVELGSFGHFARRAAGKLHRHRLFADMPGRFLQRLARVADRRLARDHFGHVKARAEPPHDRAEWHVGDPRHGCQDNGVFDRQRAELNGCKFCHGLPEN